MFCSLYLSSSYVNAYVLKSLSKTFDDARMLTKDSISINCLPTTIARTSGNNNQWQKPHKNRIKNHLQTSLGSSRLKCCLGRTGLYDPFALQLKELRILIFSFAP